MLHRPAPAVVPLPIERAGELFTLQRACWVSEAQATGSPFLPPLTQTLDELVAELARVPCLAVFDGPRLIGSVRSTTRGDTVVVNRLMVAPDQQGRGLGRLLLAAVEAGTALPRAALFTGAASTANIRFYERNGYVQTHREQVADVEVVHLVKQLRQSSRTGTDSTP